MSESSNYCKGHRGLDRIVVRFATTYVISAYHHWCCEFKSCSGRGVEHYVLKFISDLRQIGGFLRLLYSGSSTNKTDHHNITEILLKVTLNTIKPTKKTPIRLLLSCSWVVLFTSLLLCDAWISIPRRRVISKKVN
jgi:hypothetical protein